ncbi:hypothetical protein B7486_05320 [cyanobacterium TDX16]|nr:hypothetical protein B7486_05320 [cyanobacterium TDX16]
MIRSNRLHGFLLAAFCLMTCMGGGCPMQMPTPGPEGPPGPMGTDGQLRIYGNGSAGARVVSGNENWNDASQAPINLQFTDLTISAGATLMLPSGMTIRCTGTFTNNGNIVVRTGADGGFAGQDGPGNDDLANGPVDPVAGIGTIAAQAGDAGDNAAARFGGRGGFGISEFEARQVTTVATAAGGGGAAAGTDASGGVTDNKGSAGGGGVRILVMGAITNSADATVSADGAEGEGGGGAGGVIIMASMTSITNAGAISANGGDGEAGDSNEGPSGGGGGGVVHFLAPTITNSGTATVAGGAAGAVGPGVSAVDRFGGGGGGASGGSGGNGGIVPAGANPTPLAATGGASGFVLQSQLDPTSLF